MSFILFYLICFNVFLNLLGFFLGKSKVNVFSYLQDKKSFMKKSGFPELLIMAASTIFASKHRVITPMQTERRRNNHITRLEYH